MDSFFGLRINFYVHIIIIFYDFLNVTLSNSNLKPKIIEHFHAVVNKIDVGCFNQII